MDGAVLLGGILAAVAGCAYLGVWVDNVRRDRKVQRHRGTRK